MFHKKQLREESWNYHLSVNTVKTTVCVVMLNLILNPVRDCTRRTVINILHSLLLVFEDVIIDLWQRKLVCCVQKSIIVVQTSKNGVEQYGHLLTREPALYTNINTNY